MDLYIYSDESGVFDKVHNEIFVFGGLVFIGKEEKEEYSRRYIAAENAIRRGKYLKSDELKASKINNISASPYAALRSAHCDPPIRRQIFLRHPGVT